MAGLYLHIPFCASKCIYCDFYSMPKGSHQVSFYIEAILKEAQMREQELHGSVLNTLYIGGGTPSLLNKRELETLMNGLHQSFDLSSVSEFTIEVNPDDVTEDLVNTLKELGVNRVSMGVQSFHYDELKFLNRRHNSEQAISAIPLMRRLGIENISIDLIYGIPGQTLDSWIDNVNVALAQHVQHISAYTLMYEKGTRLTTLRDFGKIQEVGDELVAAMYEYLVSALKKEGYLHYEVSNFALPGYQSLHNSNYWNLTPYLGLGVAAHSFDGNIRRFNAANLKQYMQTINQGKIYAEEEQLSAYERYDEYVMLRLRTSDGISPYELKDRFGDKFYGFFKRKASDLANRGLLIIENGHILIPEDKVMVSDSITCELLWDL